MVKIFSAAKLHGLGLSCSTPLREGLQKTVDWFVKARQEGKARL